MKEKKNNIYNSKNPAKSNRESVLEYKYGKDSYLNKNSNNNNYRNKFSMNNSQK